jgi:glutamine---fructose-6-phosphate transaminase (isomerizing)
VHQPLPGHAGIGHTRRAVHGAATETNAHRSSRVAVVHNGIIENFRELRAGLADLGVQPQSQTDTETVSLWCARHMERGLGPVEAARATLAQLQGTFALASLFEREGNLMIDARRGTLYPSRLKVR